MNLFRNLLFWLVLALVGALVAQQVMQDPGEVYIRIGREGYRMTLADGSMWEFDGYIKSFGNEIDRAGIITVPITIKISGDPEFTPAS